MGHEQAHGSSIALSVTVDDWRDADGKLWTPNTPSPIGIPALKLQDKSWLIGEVTHSLNTSGTHCDLLLMPREAFLPEPILLNPGDQQVLAALNKVREAEAAAAKAGAR